MSIEYSETHEGRSKKRFWKYCIWLFIAISTGLGVYFFIINHKSIDGLVAHLRSQGLTVENISPGTAEEQQFLRDFGRLADDFKRKTGDMGPSIAESQSLVIDGIEVMVTRYARVSDAREVYDVQKKIETQSQLDDVRTGTPHERSDFFLNENFLMRIDYYAVKPPVGDKITLGGNGVIMLDLDQRTVAAIQSAFASY